MKEKIRKILEKSAQQWAPLPPFDIDRPKVKVHGELATNLAMVLSKEHRGKPLEIAREIIRNLADPEGIVESVQVAGAGFLNFVFKKKGWQESLHSVIREGDQFGRSDLYRGKKALVEFISANPTGPLHIGNARGGPLGDVIASLLEATGYQVTREYYVNDVGGQIEKMGKSLLSFITGKSEMGEPEYQGEYMKDIARAAEKTLGDQTSVEDYGRFGVGRMLGEIQEDCKEVGIQFDSWIHEKKDILDKSETAQVLEELKKKGVTVKKEGALWFAPGDDYLKDRECVLEKSSGKPTYFANDIAYHVGKYKRGYDRIINVWGSNHHGHVPRIQAAVKSLGFDPQRLETVLYQFVRIKRGTEAVKMSKRGGTFVTAREVLDEVGRDAFRFFLLMRAAESHLDFDLELAKRHTQENPVYYVQYAHARLASLERKAVEMGISWNDSPPLERLELPEEIEMIRMIQEFPDEVERAATNREPHRIPFYLLEITKAFQAYYTRAKTDSRYRVLSGDVDTSQAKLYLCRALKITISQGLKLLGISAPEVMTQDG